jgi:hypothetical protein
MKQANAFLTQLDAKIIQAEVIKEIPPE